MSSSKNCNYGGVTSINGMLAALRAEPEWERYVKDSAYTRNVRFYLYLKNDFFPSGGLTGPL